MNSPLLSPTLSITVAVTYVILQMAPNMGLLTNEERYILY